MGSLKSIKDENAKNVIYRLSEALMRHFDLHFEKTIQDEFFHLYAYHRNDFGKSFLTKSTVYEGYSVFEHIFVRYVDTFKEEDFEDFKDLLIYMTSETVKPNKTHKKSLVTGIIICNSSVDENIKKLNKKFHIRKEYKFCFHGWSETQMFIYSMKDKDIYSPKRNAKDLEKVLSEIVF